MELARVKVGEEFRTALRISIRKGIRCECCDLSVGQLGDCIKQCIRPTLRNLSSAVRQWLGFPRSVFRMLWPDDGDIDVVGCALLQLAALPIRTWIVMFGAAAAAS